MPTVLKAERGQRADLQALVIAILFAAEAASGPVVAVVVISPCFELMRAEREGVPSVGPKLHLHLCDHPGLVGSQGQRLDHPAHRHSHPFPLAHISLPVDLRAPLYLAEVFVKQVVAAF